jgi:hypothetical protein
MTTTLMRNLQFPAGLAIPILQFGLSLDALSMPAAINVGLYPAMVTGRANSFSPVPLNDEVISNILPTSISPIVSSRDAVDEVLRQWGKDAASLDGTELVETLATT